MRERGWLKQSAGFRVLCDVSYLQVGPVQVPGADAVVDAIDRSLESPGSITVDKHGACKFSCHAAFVNVKARREKTHCSLTSKIQITILQKSHANETIF
jgi:hypothetical protein